MVQDSKRIAAPADLAELATQFSELREDLAKLTQSVASIAERRGRQMASDISDGMGEAMQYVERKGRNAEAELERSVAAHPYISLGLAAAAGLLIGALARR